MVRESVNQITVATNEDATFIQIYISFNREPILQGSSTVRQLVNQITVATKEDATFIQIFASSRDKPLFQGPQSVPATTLHTQTHRRHRVMEKEINTSA